MFISLRGSQGQEHLDLFIRIKNQVTDRGQPRLTTTRGLMVRLRNSFPPSWNSFKDSVKTWVSVIEWLCVIMGDFNPIFRA